MPISASFLSHPLIRRSRIPVQALAALFVPLISASTALASAPHCAKPAGAISTFHAAFTNGTMSLGSAKATGLSAKACGAVSGKLGALMSTIQPGDIEFSVVSVKLLFISLPSTITVNAALSSPFSLVHVFTSAEVNVTANVSASARLLGFSCSIGPLAPTLTTGKSGSLKGKTFTGSMKNGFTGKVVANDFSVPAIKVSKTCPWLIATLSNLIVGLPAAPGKASISMEGSITTP